MLQQDKPRRVISPSLLRRLLLAFCELAVEHPNLPESFDIHSEDSHWLPPSMKTTGPLSLLVLYKQMISPAYRLPAADIWQIMKNDKRFAAAVYNFQKTIPPEIVAKLRAKNPKVCVEKGKKDKSGAAASAPSDPHQVRIIAKLTTLRFREVSRASLATGVANLEKIMGGKTFWSARVRDPASHLFDYITEARDVWSPLIVEVPLGQIAARFEAVRQIAKRPPVPEDDLFAPIEEQDMEIADDAADGGATPTLARALTGTTDLNTASVTIEYFPGRRSSAQGGGQSGRRGSGAVRTSAEGLGGVAPLPTVLDLYPPLGSGLSSTIERWPKFSSLSEYLFGAQVLKDPNEELPPFEKPHSPEAAPKPFLPPAPTLSFPRVPAELADALDTPKLRNTTSTTSLASSTSVDDDADAEQHQHDATSGDSSEEEALSTAGSGRYSELYLRHDRKMRAIFEQNRLLARKRRRLTEEKDARPRAGDGDMDGDVNMTAAGEKWVAESSRCSAADRKGLVEVIPGVWRRPLLPSVPTPENIPQLPTAPPSAAVAAADGGGGGSSASAGAPPNLDDVSPPPSPSPVATNDGSGSGASPAGGAGNPSASSGANPSAVLTRRRGAGMKRRQVLRIPARIEAKFRMPQTSTYGVFERHDRFHVESICVPRDFSPSNLTFAADPDVSREQCLFLMLHVHWDRDEARERGSSVYRGSPCLSSFELHPRLPDYAIRYALSDKCVACTRLAPLVFESSRKRKKRDDKINTLQSQWQKVQRSGVKVSSLFATHARRAAVAGYVEQPERQTLKK